MTSHQPRFLLIDGLRGLAASAVMFYHLYGGFQRYSPKEFSDQVPRVLDFLLSHGYLGVQVFFVISGFVMAHSLRRYPLDLRNFGVFALRRSVRLDPPYWLAIWCLLAVNIAGNALFKGREVDIPTPLGVVANMFYLDNIVGAKSVVPVGWTLCLEFQFYLVFFLLLWMAKVPSSEDRPSPDLLTFSRGRVLLIFVPVMMLALCWPLGIFQENLHQGLWLPQWFMFLLGVFAYWSLTTQRAAQRWFLFFLGIVGTLAVLHSLGVLSPSNTFVGPFGFGNPASVLWATFCTASLIFVAGKLGKLECWLSGPVLQYLGRISYSLYLMHVITGSRLMSVLDRFGFDSAAGSIVLVLIGLVGSLVGAHLMYCLVERPCVRLGERLRKQLVSNPAPKATPAFSRVSS